MPVPYPVFRHGFPPRTNLKTGSGFYDPIVQHWASFDDVIAQWKANGSNAQVPVFPNTDIQWWSRHYGDKRNERLRYTTHPKMREQILDVTPRKGITLYNGELIHSKTKTVKDVFYIFDVLVWEGQHLIGVPYRERYAIIDGIVKDYLEPDYSPSKGIHVYKPRNILPADWESSWLSIQNVDWIEGLFLKRMGEISRLKYGLSQVNNDAYACRIRKPTKNALA